MSEIKIYPQVRASKVVQKTDFNISGHLLPKQDIEFNLHEDSEIQDYQESHFFCPELDKNSQQEL